MRMGEMERGRCDVPSLTLGLEQGQNVLLPDGALNVTDDCSARVVHELNADLGDTTTRAGTTEDLHGYGAQVRWVTFGTRRTLMTLASFTLTFEEDSWSNLFRPSS
jgi:hypothetical protein